MTADEMVKKEAVSMGRDATLVSSATLDGGDDLTVVVFDLEPLNLGGASGATILERRYAVYKGDVAMMSGVVKSSFTPNSD